MLGIGAPQVKAILVIGAIRRGDTSPWGLRTTAATAEPHRTYDGKLQGLHLLVNLGAPGSRSPWVTR
jgi:hypothetical protein